jgi:CDGSH-type Zn-finger protein
MYDEFPERELGLITKEMLDKGEFVCHREEIKTEVKAKVARACPVTARLQKGQTYLYCTCGHSLYQPFCDASHRERAPDYKPLKVLIEKDQKYFMWCGCKRNNVKAGPLCDGKHSQIDDW